MEHDSKERERTVSLLERYGFFVTPVSSGIGALKVLFNQKPELIICNIELPGINGFDILKTIKNNKRLRSTPLIMTARILEEDNIHKSKRLGAAAYIRIPSTCTLLYAIKRSLNLEFLEAK